MVDKIWPVEKQLVMDAIDYAFNETVARIFGNVASDAAGSPQPHSANADVDKIFVGVSRALALRRELLARVKLVG